ncbi:hypothetical protein C0995_011491 [Termitomyces sp. Mi166|nr:hypothetical protein C0995_011491 [Termitomyces sp. Mi166\
MSDKIREFLDIPQQFVRDGNQFMTRCTKPSQTEFTQICKAVAIGFGVMGFIGYFVKLIHIPINNILVYVLSSLDASIAHTPPVEVHKLIIRTFGVLWTGD